MRCRLNTAAQVLASLLAAGCGAPSPSQEEAVGVDTLILSVIDTLGVEMGDSSLMFGMLRSADWTPDGRIAVLDMNRCCVQVFTPEGEEVARLGRRGEAPGEFQIPGAMCILPDGSIVVSDLVGGKVAVFRPDGQLREEVRGFFPTPPMDLAGTSDTSFAAISMSMTPAGDEGGEIQGALRFCSYSFGPEPETVFFEYPFDMGQGMVRRDSSSPSFAIAAGPGGSAVMAEQSDSLLLVRRFAPDGTENLTIEEEWERIPWPEEERGETMGLMITMVDGSASVEGRAMPIEDEYRTIVRSVHCDGEGRIWLEMGITSHAHFRVLSPEGDLLFVAVPSDPAVFDMCSFSITPRGMLAIDNNPDDYPKIYLLGLEGAAAL